MTDLSRRGFLKLIGAVPLAIALPSEGKIWVPTHLNVDKDINELLKPVISASEHGDLVCGWFLGDEFGPDDIQSSLEVFMDDAFWYFPANAPILALRDPDPMITRRPGLGRRSRRFVWRGSGSPIQGSSHQIIAAWNHRADLLDRAMASGAVLRTVGPVDRVFAQDKEA
jgi:hypothetical protein